MVNKITKKAILDAKKNYDAYGKEMSAINEKIATIDEKYRKLAEKEAKELKESLSALEDEQAVWNTVLSHYPEEMVNEVLGTSSSVEEEPEKADDESIVDNIYPENNESSAKEPDVVEETVEEAPDEKIEPQDEGNTPEKPASPEEWPDKTPTNEEESTEPAPVAASDDEWPDLDELPDDWK